MSEREKLEKAVADHRAAEEVDQRIAYAYKQRESENLYQMREKLGEIAAAFAPKVIVTFREKPSSRGINFSIDIGDGRTWLRKPFAGMEVRVWGNGFSIFDRFAETRSGYPVRVGTFDTVEGVAAAIREAGAAYIAARGEYPHHRPAWLDALVFLNTGVIVLAVFALCVLIWGWTGTVYGALAGWLAYHVAKAMGVWGVLLTVGIVAFFLRR